MNISQISTPLLVYILIVIFLAGGLVFYLLRKRIEKTPSVIVLYGKFVIPFIIVFGLWYVLIFNKGESLNLNDKLNLVGDISALTFAIFVGWIAFLQFVDFRANKKETELKAKKQAIFTIREQLANVGWWTNLHLNTGGYKPQDRDNWKSSEFRTRISILHTIHPFEYSFIKNASLLSGYTDLGEDGQYNNPIPGLLAGYLQWCETFNDYLRDIKNYILSQNINPETYLKISSPNISLEDLMIYLNKDENKEEKMFFLLLMEKYTSLHFDVIGCDETQHLYHYHKRLLEEINKVEDKFQIDWDNFYNKNSKR